MVSSATPANLDNYGNKRNKLQLNDTQINEENPNKNEPKQNTKDHENTKLQHNTRRRTQFRKVQDTRNTPSQNNSALGIRKIHAVRTQEALTQNCEHKNTKIRTQKSEINEQKLI